MQHIQGIARSQISFGSLEDRISVDIPVRFVDVFVAKLDLTKIGFLTKFLQKEGSAREFGDRKLYCFGGQRLPQRPSTTGMY